MAFLVSFEDSDSESPIPPTQTTRTLNTVKQPEPSTPSSISRSKPLPLQLKQSTKNREPLPVLAPEDYTTSNMDSPPTTPVAKRSQDASTTQAYDLPGRRSIDSIMSDAPSLATSDIKEFPFTSTDYTLSTSNLLGEGLWSSVYLAHSVPAGAIMSQSMFTPPLTPVKGNSRSEEDTSALPTTYAIKTPSSRSARNVLTGEARILSYLDSLRGTSSYIVPFYGQDSRTGALVLRAMPTNLEQYIITHLNTLSEADRANQLGKIFPSLALRLVQGMELIHSAGVVHADLKPSNILLDTKSSIVTPFYADFSSSIPPSQIGTTEKTTSPLGGGTWDFLSPILLKANADPTPRTDIHALAISLLYLIFGSSPFDSVGGNVFLRREMIKQNQAIHAGLNDLQNFRRLQSLQKTLGWNVQNWIEKGLGTKSLDISNWRIELEKALA